MAEPSLLDNSLRSLIATKYLSGSGIEIGALHTPLEVPRDVKVRYVDRMSATQLKQTYPELAECELVEVDIVEDGESLASIPNASVDFIIANQMIEHCQNPIFTIENWVRVLKQNGVLYMGVPDKRYTFDCDRPVTPLEHLIRDYSEGPCWSRDLHFDEWARLVDKYPQQEVAARAKGLAELNYSIHFHVWTQAEFLELLLYCRDQLSFPIEIELVQENGLEFIVILRKTTENIKQSNCGKEQLSMEDEVNKLRLDLGCGSQKKEGTIGIDIQAQPSVDYVLNLQGELLQAQLQHTQAELAESQAIIRRMESIEFWKLRTVWFRLKQAIGLTDNSASPAATSSPQTTDVPDNVAISRAMNLNETNFKAASYVRSAPNQQQALDIFKGEWSSKLPAPLETLEAGSALLFEDVRIEWCAAQLGGFEGKSVLELGPLEAGHTYMLECLGAASILSIEANTRAYLKCLIVKELLELRRTRFLCGDFVEYLRNNQTKFDVCIASGVLYHMRNPAELIALAAKASDRLFIWTHYYDQAIISKNPNLAHKFSSGVPNEYAGFRHTLYRQEYKAALDWKGFCGGSEVLSYWLSREDIIACLKHFGLNDIQTNFEHDDHPNGPSFALTAVRTT